MGTIKFKYKFSCILLKRVSNLLQVEMRLSNLDNWWCNNFDT